MTGRQPVTSRAELARLLSRIEAQDPGVDQVLSPLPAEGGDFWVIGVTGPPGVGKSTLTSALVTQLRQQGETVAVLAVDPTSSHTGGAVLGDRVRMMGHIGDAGVFIRSMASRGEVGGLALAVPASIRACAQAGFGWVIVESVGVGQIVGDIARFVDTIVVVLDPGGGDEVQVAKAGINENADVFAVNKSDVEGAIGLVQALRAHLHLGASEPGAWSAPVVLLSALNGSNVDELLAAVGAHRSHLISEGLAQSRLQRRVAEWQLVCRSMLWARLQELFDDPRAQRLAEDVETAALTPSDAALRLLGLLPAPEHVEV